MTLNDKHLSLPPPQNGKWEKWKERVNGFARKTADGLNAARKEMADAQERRRQEKAEEHQRTIAERTAEYQRQRLSDLNKALKQNISTGGAGMPYLAVAPVMSFSRVGHNGKIAFPAEAFERVNDSLWGNALYYGCDAVIHTRYEFKTGVAHFRNVGASVVNNMLGAVGSVSGMSFGQMSESRSKETVTIVAFGTAVKLLPSDQKPSPDDYAKFSIDDLDLQYWDQESVS